MPPATQLLLVLLVAIALNLGTIAMLHDARQERDALEMALIDTVLQRNALRELADYRHRRAQAATDLLHACRDRLALRDAQHDSELVMIALKGAEYYDVPVHDYIATTTDAE